VKVTFGVGLGSGDVLPRQEHAQLAEAGATKLWIGSGGGDLDRQVYYMRMFGEQILPHFQ
jgi:hypothetical protein